jgi:hypothetical protein
VDQGKLPEALEIYQQSLVSAKALAEQDCAAPRFFVGTGQVQRRIISWEVARGVWDNLTREEL